MEQVRQQDMQSLLFLEDVGALLEGENAEDSGESGEFSRFSR